mmetsp:Transcript_72431/g.205593  ORF Transcript_72431/g.205593 Transcript_72431/m.205593 type:complete len:424 (+) Transcript_72431:58-1329(+)
MAFSGEVWEVTGGVAKGGLIVREGKDTSSPEVEGRLATSALIVALEHDVEAERMLFEKIAGSGPESGWVSTGFKGKPLLVKVTQSEDDEADIEEGEAEELEVEEMYSDFTCDGNAVALQLYSMRFGQAEAEEANFEDLEEGAVCATGDSEEGTDVPESDVSAELEGDVGFEGLTSEDTEEEEEEEAASSGKEAGVARATVAPAAAPDFAPPTVPGGVQVFRGEWDEEGVFFYQAYKDEIADWAVEHQRFGGPGFNATRMTWIKPSFAWVLYRSGYGHKHNQNRILKVKLPHEAVADLLSRCQCKEGGGGSNGRVQWDPARDLMSGDGKAPRMMLRDRAIQVGLKGSLSELYVRSVMSIQDVTELSHRVGEAHRAKSKAAVDELLPDLPAERPYLPRCPEADLRRLHMIPGAPPPTRAHRRGRR